MMRWYWVNFQCRGVLQILIIVGQGPIALAVGAGGSCMDIFTLVCHFCFLSSSFWETARYRLKYCLKGPLSPKQPTKQFTFLLEVSFDPEFLTVGGKELYNWETEHACKRAAIKCCA